MTESELLTWREETTHPEADKLGADLLYARDLYKDLQVMYKKGSVVSSDDPSCVDGVTVSTNPAYGMGIDEAAPTDGVVGPTDGVALNTLEYI